MVVNPYEGTNSSEVFNTPHSYFDEINIRKAVDIKKLENKERR